MNAVSFLTNICICRIYKAMNSAAGNQTAYGSFYDAENRNTMVPAYGSTYATYAYDGDCRRVKKTVTGGAATYYVYDAMRQMAVEYSTQAPTTTGTSYLLTDMLGSVRTSTDQTGAVVENYDCLPFGRMLSRAQNGRANLNSPDDPDAITINPTSRTPQKFTGKERDAETRLDYFGARYLSADAVAAIRQNADKAVRQSPEVKA
jgi:hypothetical protein